MIGTEWANRTMKAMQTLSLYIVWSLSISFSAVYMSKLLGTTIHAGIKEMMNGSLVNGKKLILGFQKESLSYGVS